MLAPDIRTIIFLCNSGTMPREEVELYAVKLDFVVLQPVLE